MGRATQDPVTVPFGTAVPVTPPTGAQTILDPIADTWIWSFAASGGQISIVTTGAYHWWYVNGVWRRDVRPWSVPSDLLIGDGEVYEDVTRARAGASGAYMQLPSVTGGTLAIALIPGRGGV